MRVLWFVNIELPYVSKYFGRGVNTGAGSWIIMLLESLRKYPEIELHIANSNFLYKKELIIQDGEVTYYTLKREKFRQYRAAGKNEINAIKMLIQNVNPDIVHVFGTEQYYGVVTKYIKIPVVIRVQGILNSYIHHFFGGIPVFCFNWIDYYLYFLFVNRVKQEREIFKCNHYFEGQSDWDEGWVKKYSPEAKYYRNFPLIRDVFKNGQWISSKADRRTVLVLASNVAYKGLHIFFNALSIFLTERKHLKIRLISKIPESGYGKYIEKCILKLNGYCEVKVLGYLNESELVNEFSGAGLLVIPSFAENESLLKLEANTYGLPTISSFSGGMPTATGSRMLGSYFPSGDAESLATKLRHFYDNYEEYVSIAVRDRDYILSTFNDPLIVNKTITMYKEIISITNQKRG